MTRVVIVGEIYNADLYPSTGPIFPGWGGHPANRPPGSWGGPVDPGFGGGGPDHPWYGGRPDRPDQGLPGGGYPSTGPIVPPQGGAPVTDYEPLPPPEDVYSQYVVSVWNPKTASWTTKSYPPR
jgi:hypothetical protein